MARNTPRRRAAASYAKEFPLGNSNYDSKLGFPEEKKPSGLLIRSAQLFRLTL
jgi:hypothetical protein